MRVLLAPALLVATAAAAAEPAVIDPEAQFPEGPAVVDGTLHYVEYAAHTLMAWDGSGPPREVWRQEGCGPSAVLPLGDRFAITCYDSGTIAYVGRDGATLGALAKDADGQGFLGPNDLTADGAGGFWFTASGPWESAPIVGTVVHVGADGAARVVARDLHYANGIARAPDGARLYVIESEASRVISFAVGEGGALSDRRLFARIGQADPASGAFAYPDGMEFGPDGNLWVGQYSSGRIVALSPEGGFVRAVEVPSTAAPNLAFSADGKTLYVAAVDQTEAAPYRGKVYAVALE